MVTIEDVKRLGYKVVKQYPSVVRSETVYIMSYRGRPTRTFKVKGGQIIGVSGTIGPEAGPLPEELRLMSGRQYARLAREELARQRQGLRTEVVKQYPSGQRAAYIEQPPATEFEITTKEGKPVAHYTAGIRVVGGQKQFYLASAQPLSPEQRAEIERMIIQERPGFAPSEQVRYKVTAPRYKPPAVKVEAGATPLPFLTRLKEAYKESQEKIRLSFLPKPEEVFTPSRLAKIEKGAYYAQYTTPSTIFLSQQRRQELAKFQASAIKSAYTEVREKPVKYGLIVTTSALAPSAVAALPAKAAKPVSVSSKLLGGLYGGSRLYEFATAKGPEAKGQVFGQTLTELGAFKLGSMIAAYKPKPPVVKKRVVEVRHMGVEQTPKPKRYHEYMEWVREKVPEYQMAERIRRYGGIQRYYRSQVKSAQEYWNEPIIENLKKGYVITRAGEVKYYKKPVAPKIKPTKPKPLITTYRETKTIGGKKFEFKLEFKGGKRLLTVSQYKPVKTKTGQIQILKQKVKTFDMAKLQTLQTQKLAREAEALLTKQKVKVRYEPRYYQRTEEVPAMLTKAKTGLKYGVAMLSELKFASAVKQQKRQKVSTILLPKFKPFTVQTAATTNLFGFKIKEQPLTVTKPKTKLTTLPGTRTLQRQAPALTVPPSPAPSLTLQPPKPVQYKYKPLTQPTAKRKRGLPGLILFLPYRQFRPKRFKLPNIQRILRYTPSLAGVLGGYRLPRAPSPRLWTGLEVRPIVPPFKLKIGKRLKKGKRKKR